MNLGFLNEKNYTYYMKLNNNFPFQEYLPFWNTLTDKQREQVQRTARWLHAEKQAIIHSSGHCTGFLLILTGRLRCYNTGDDGREITLYRLFPYDVCLLSASCILNGIQFAVTIQAEQETDYILIPAAVYQNLTEQSAPAAKFTNEVMASRFSEVMWLMDQILHKRMDARIAGFLIEEIRLSGLETITITHEKIAQHLGTAREVVSRCLKYLADEGIVSLSRGGITVSNMTRLEQLAEGSIP